MRRRACGAALASLMLAACAATTAVPAAGDRTPKPAPAAPTTFAPVQLPQQAPGFALVNPGFESTAPERASGPEGWFTFQHAGDKSYEFTVDKVEPHSGQRSLRIDHIGPEPYGAVAQAITTKQYAGKVARYSGWLRTKDATDAGAVLTIVAQQSGAILAHNFMAEAPVKGTTGWKRYTVTLAVPAGTERIEIGAMLQGKGSLWLDDVELQFVDR